MKILVTGAGGFIGRGLILSLVGQDQEVLALDNNWRGDLQTIPSHPRIQKIECDILDLPKLCELTQGIDAVYHLAYINGTEFFYTLPEKILEVGIVGTHNILKACLRNRVPHFFLASSSEVYQKARVIPTPEEVECVIPDVTNPRYSYGGGKIAAELLTINYLRKSSTRHIIFRPHNVYGPAMGFEHVLPQLIRKIYEAKKKIGQRMKAAEIELQGTGEETRSFIYIDDAVRAIEACTLQTRESGIYHIGTMEEVTIKELVEVLGSVLEVDLTIRCSDRPLGSTTRRCPQTDKIKRLGFSPRVSLKEGVRQTIDWYWDYYSRRETS